MTSTPEDRTAEAAQAPATKPRRRRAASRPAGPPVHAESAPVTAAAPAAEPDEVTPAVEPSPAPEPAPVESSTVESTPVESSTVESTPVDGDEAPVEAPKRRSRRSTRKTAAPAPAEVAEEAAAVVEETPAPPVPVQEVLTPEPASPEPASPEASAPETTTTPEDATASEPVAPKRRTRRPRKTAAAPVVEVVPEAVDPETPEAATPVEAPAAQEAPAAAAAPDVVEEPAPAASDLADLMDDPVLMRAAGLARGEASPAERAAEAAARATALFFQAPDVEEQPRRSRRASAPAGPPRPAQTTRHEDDVVEDHDEDHDDEQDGWDGSHDHEDVRGTSRPAVDDDLEDDDDQDEDGTSEDDADESGEGGSTPRRRRRRGGRGRRSRTREDGEDGESTDEPHGADGADEDDAEDRSRPVEDADDADEATDGEDGDQDETSGSSSRRRRRRRRRSGGAEGEETSPDDPPNTVVRVREPRRSRSTSGSSGSSGSTGSSGGGGTGEDEITALKGSTRLEAKKQRRREGREAGRKRTILTEAEFLARRESVERVMVVRELAGTTQIGVLEDDVLVEHYAAKQTQTTMVGNVYLGRVQNVLPSMEAAFVDVGKGRNAVLYAGEVNWDAAGLEGQPRRIEAALKSGDPVLVQVTKDPVGHKGARLTSQVSLPGRYLVYVPRGSMTGISRKLPDTERTRLKKVLKKVVPEGAGVIVRTAAEGVAEEELAADVQRLQAAWEAIQAKAGSKNAPVLLHGEPDLTVRVVRDVFNEDFTRLVISGEEAWETVRGYVDDVAPDLAERLERWEPEDPDGPDVFARYRVDEQLQKALGRKVWLPSGGSLVIDPTEAMHVIDVNTGKFTGSGGTLEETVTRNNLEAAEEIVRQLRLRDIGGIIVIDFIDMVLESNRDLVLRRLVECLGRDRTKHQVAEVTSLGLVQMTRKRTGQGLAAVLEELETEQPPLEPSGGSRGGSSSGSSSSGGSSSGGSPAGNGVGSAGATATGGDPAGSANGAGKSRSRRGRGREKAAEPEREAPAAPAAASREPARNEAVLAAMAAVAAAAARREAGEPGADETPHDAPAGE